MIMMRAIRGWNHSQVSTFVVDRYSLCGIFFLKDYESLHEQLSDLLRLDQLGRWSVVLIYKIRATET
ncbi:hypothetical protein MRB53_014368 [Persea americana]|uniref:Uncharacterized protein n=1 Tax=Persea americana TaxID=3435 RepID=A0ACC2KB45_PERAE|nr:hypothetical protein MRB53_014368 [Persea americana]